MERGDIEARVDELREQHPGREEFVVAVGALAESLDEGEREMLGRVLLERQPDTAAFDILEERGWLKRTMRKIEDRRP